MIPVYRATVYAPRSVSAAETVVLTPAAAGPHNDRFQVSTKQGMSLATPAAPSVTVVGVAGTTAYSYYVVAVDAGGRRTIAGPVGSTATGNATLSGTNYNTISWAAVPNAVSYDVLKGGTAQRLANVAGTTVNDTGQATTAYTVATRNETLWQPFLDLPRGRRGRLDPREHMTDTGTMMLSLVDKRTGSANNERWVTAFAGDAAGIYNMLGLKVFVEESLDDGVTWTNFYTGRVQEVVLDGYLLIGLQLRDMGEDLQQEVFVGDPHSSITYAARTPWLPRGILSEYGSIPKVSPLTGKISSGDALHRRVNFDNGDWRLRMISQTGLGQTIVDMGGIEATMMAKITIAGVTTHFRVVELFAEVGRVNEIVGAAIKPLPVSNPLYTATLPTIGASCTLTIVPLNTLQLSDTCPLLIDMVHGVQLWKDMLDGKFGALKLDGTVKRTVAYDAAVFDALIADVSFPKLRFIVTGKRKLNDAVEMICKTYNLAYRLDELGRVTIIDLRRTTTLTSASSIGDADLLAGEPPTWSQVREDAITRMDVTFYRDQQATLGEAEKDTSIPVHRIVSMDQPIIALDLSPRVVDLGEQPLKLDAEGLRYFEGERVPDGTLRLDQIRRHIDHLIDDMAGPFLGGAAYMTLACRRSTAVAAAKPGTFHLLTISALPDPTTNRRGGPRAALCVERSEDGARVTLGFLDLGENVTALAPTPGTAVLNTADPKHAIDWPLTLNAVTDPVQVWAAVTTTAETVRPAEKSERWQMVTRQTATGTALLTDLPAGSRVWLRARSMPTAAVIDGLRFPSVWVYPPGLNGYLDTTGEAAITGLTVTAITKSTAYVAWTVGDASAAVELLLTTGAAPAAWTDAQVALILPPGTQSVTLRRLQGPTVQHTVGVRHRVDTFRSRGPILAATFTTTATPAVAPRPAGIATGY